MAPRHILALDQGTTGSTAFVFDEKGRPVGRGYSEFPQHYPKPGWVEHDPADIWETTLRVGRAAIEDAGLQGDDIRAIGITNQRETAVLWDRQTGNPLIPAIVWQDRRTAELCARLREDGHEPLVRERTGLVIDSYFSGPKIRWAIVNHEHVLAAAEAGTLAFGTVDSWLVHKLTNGKVHATDTTNASRTMLYDIHRCQWSPELLEVLGVPGNILPEVRDSIGDFGSADARWFGAEIPIRGIAGDQQAALFGQGCWRPGDIKNTYGTGCFALTNTGDKPVQSENGLVTTIAWSRDGKATYALEGSIFIAGAAVQWLRDGLGIIKKASETEALAESVEDTHGAYFVPAFSGLGAPHWDESARGVIVGLTRGVTKAHIARATLEAICHQSDDLFEAMRSDADADLTTLKVDGGATENRFLCQFQADISGLRVARPVIRETTALGAAFLAGIGAGLWKDTDELADVWQQDALFEPRMDTATRQRHKEGWHRAVQRTRDWA